MADSEWTKSEHVDRYLAHADTFPHRAEGERILLDHVPLGARRILDLGTGDGRLLALLRADRPESIGVAVDVSEPMLERARRRFAGAPVELVRQDLAEPLPDLGRFDGVVSSFAIHHLEDERKRSIYAEIFELLEPGGVFANLEHVSSPTPRLHRRFYEALGYPSDWEDSSNRLTDVETQLGWLGDSGFEDVDCYWKWLEMALLIGVKPECSAGAEAVNPDHRDAGAVAIVRAGPERIAELEPLWRSLHEHHMAVATRPPHLAQRSADDAWARRKEGYERWLAEPDAFVLLAERRGRPVGYAVVHVVEGLQSWETGDRIGELQTLTLLPEARGAGIGTLLMEAIEHELLRLGIDDLIVTVAAGNDGAERFYERRGFTTRLNVLLGPVSRGSA